MIFWKKAIGFYETNLDNFSDRTNDSSLPSSKCLSSGDSWGSEEGREYRNRVTPPSCDTKLNYKDTTSEDPTTSDTKSNYKDKIYDNAVTSCQENVNDLGKSFNNATPSENKLNQKDNISENDMNENNNDSSINDNDISTDIDNVNSSNVEDKKPNDFNMTDEVDKVDSSLQNTIWKISGKNQFLFFLKAQLIYNVAHIIFFVKNRICTQTLQKK